MKIIAVIPARFKSTRFPGKPLSDIHGKPMIWWVYQHCMMVSEFNDVYVATDDATIMKVCEQFGMNVILTSEYNQTGTDRVAEVAEKIQADLYVNVQGDEPLMEPNVIRAAIEPFLLGDDILITNCMTKICNPVDLVNSTVPKVITNKDNVALYLTRSTCPYPKGSINYDYYKQVCVYGFRPEALKFFREYGSKNGKAKMENIEDIEILRFIENGYKVQFVEVSSNTVAIDTPKDLEKVNEIVEKRIIQGTIDVDL